MRSASSPGRIAGAFRLSLARAQSEVAIAVSLLSILANPSWKPRTAGASSSCDVTFSLEQPMARARAF